jgi:putative membrane protein
MKRGITATSGLLIFGLVSVLVMPPAVIASEQTPNKVVSYETLFASLDADGTPRSMRLVNQLRVQGEGDFLVVDPTSTEGFRNLSGASGASVGDGAVEWRVEGVAGSEEIVFETRPDVPSPLAIGITYYLDGEQVDGSDLVGKGGRVQIVFDVTNTTSQPMEITFEDGTGNETTVTEDVPIPMVGELTLTLPKGTFTEVDAPGADVVTAPNGDLTVRWGMVLVPPIGPVTQSFSLTARTGDFSLGPARLIGAAVSPEDRPALAHAEEELSDNADAAASLYGGSSTLSSNLERLHNGSKDLLAGTRRLAEGTRELYEGLIEAADGSGRLTSGLGDAVVGSGQLTAGIGTAAAGSATLTAGLGDARAGSAEITSGLNSLASGMKRILRGLRRLANGLPDAHQGAIQLAEAAAALDAALATVRAGLQAAQAGAGNIQAGANAIAACLTGGGTPCDGNPSVSAIAGQILAGAGDIGTGAGNIAAGAGNIVTGAQGIQALSGGLVPACEADGGAAGCPNVANLAAQIGGTAGAIEGGAGAIQAGANAIQAGAGQIQTGAGGIQLIVGGLATSLGAIAAGAGDIAAGLGAAVAGIGLPTDAADASIRGGLNAMRLGALQLAAGLGEAIAGIGDALTDETLIGGMTQAVQGADLLRAGSGRLTAGLGDAHDGSSRLTAGLGEAHSGSGRLTAGLRTAADGSGQLTAGLNRGVDGSGQIADGAEELRDGAQQIEQNIYLVNEFGVAEIARSASAKVAEIDRQLKLLDAQEARAEAEAVLYGPPSSDQAETVVGGSSVVLTLDALDGRTRASTTRGVGAAVALVLLALLALLALGTFRRRPAQPA